MATRKSSNTSVALSSAHKLSVHVMPNVEELERKLRHLTAGLWMCTGTGQSAFQELADCDQQNYLCMLADLAADSQGLAQAVQMQLVCTRSAAEVAHG